MLGNRITVHVPVEVGRDAFNAAIHEFRPVTVDDVLVAPGSTVGLGTDRPDGMESKLVMHFPASFTASLRGCEVDALGARWAVVGDPLPFPKSPTRWNRPVEAVRVDG